MQCVVRITLTYAKVVRITIVMQSDARITTVVPGSARITILMQRWARSLLWACEVARVSVLPAVHEASQTAFSTKRLRKARQTGLGPMVLPVCTTAHFEKSGQVQEIDR